MLLHYFLASIDIIEASYELRVLIYTTRVVHSCTNKQPMPEENVWNKGIGHLQ